MPDLALQTAPQEPVSPPTHLRAAGKRLWRELVGSFDFEPCEITLLALLCEHIDTQAEARKLVRREGLTIENPKTCAVREHPALATDRMASRLIASLLRQLNVPSDDAGAPYTPRSGKKGLSGRRAASGSGRRALR